MIDFLLNQYLPIKALHVIAVIAWMAGLFYLPRLFVYHSQTTPGTGEYARFVTMERKLLKIIMFPAGVAVWVLGVVLTWLMDYWLAPWFLTKMALVVLLTVVHILNEIWARDFAKGINRHSERFYRIWNEAPTLLTIGIVILAVVKPF